MIRINDRFIISLLIVLICFQRTITGTNTTEYQNYIALKNNFGLFWTMSQNDINFQLIYSFEYSPIPPNYYVSIGFTPKAMIGANAVVGILNEGNISILDYYLGDKNQQDVIQSNRQHLTSKSWTIINNTLKMSFSRKLIVNGATSIVSNGPTKVVYARGPIEYDNPFVLKYHPFRELVLIDFSSGTSEKYATSPWKLAHAILMGLSFGVLLPVGIIIARFGDKNNNQWFLKHKIIQSMGVTLALIGWIIALTKFFSKRYNTHRIFGMICMVLVLLQPINAFFRPAPADSTGRKSQSRVRWEYLHSIGYIVVVLGFFQIYIGLRIFKPGVEWMIIFVIMVVSFIFIFIFLSLLSMYSKMKVPSDVFLLEQSEAHC